MPIDLTRGRELRWQALAGERKRQRKERDRLSRPVFLFSD